MGREAGSGRWRALALDRTRGARALSGAALAELDRVFRTVRPDDPARARQLLRESARSLREAQPAMGPFLEWATELDRRAAAPSRPSQWALLRWVGARRRTWRLEPARLAKTVRRRLPPRVRVLTISRSASVADALRSVPRPRRPATVLALVSEPGGEGRTLASELRSSGIHARAVPDGALRSAVRAVDLVLVGADAIDRDGTLVHKVGTRRLAEAARRERRPFVVLAGRSKWLRRARLPRRLPARFDRTPPNLISAYWTDRGSVLGKRGSGGAP